MTTEGQTWDNKVSILLLVFPKWRPVTDYPRFQSLHLHIIKGRRGRHTLLLEIILYTDYTTFDWTGCQLLMSAFELIKCKRQSVMPYIIQPPGSDYTTTFTWLGLLEIIPKGGGGGGPKLLQIHTYLLSIETVCWLYLLCT